MRAGSSSCLRVDFNPECLIVLQPAVGRRCPQDAVAVVLADLMNRQKIQTAMDRLTAIQGNQQLAARKRILALNSLRCKPNCSMRGSALFVKSCGPLSMNVVSVAATEEWRMEKLDCPILLCSLL